MKRRRPAVSPSPPAPADAHPETDDDCWDALLLDDDYEPTPEPGDFDLEPD